jgi:hypothetical protein
MPNLRIIYDNAADRAALAASTTAGTLGVANLQNNRKGRPWRATGTTARLGATWGAPERIGGVFLPFCNLSPTATMRVRASNELAVQNQLTFSDHFMNPAFWQISGLTITPNVATTPEGSTGAAKVVEGTGNTLHELYRPFAAVAARRTTISICVKAAGRSKVRLGLVTAGYAIGTTAVFDLAAGTASSITNYGGMTGALVTIVPLSDGWYRCAIELVTSVDGTWYFALDPVIGTNTVIYQGDGVSGVYVTHAQIEAGSLSSYYPATVNFTGRASTGTFIGNNGLVQVAAANVARMQYNPANLAAPPYLLLENAATNLALQSGDISHAVWGARWGGAASVAADATVLAPDGTPAYKVTATNGGSGIGQGVALTAGVSYTFSMWVAAGVAARSLGVWPSSGGGSVLAFSAIPANLPMARYSITYTAATTGIYYFGLQSLLMGSSLWCACGQVQVGNFADSYIPTTTVAVTRAADIATSTLATRPAGYIDAWQSYSYDSGMLPACPAAAAAVDGFTPLQAASAYGNGGGAYARHWLPAPVPALGLAIDIKDPANLQGYVEAGRLVAGDYWSPANNPDYGASVTIMDASTHARSDAGDLWTDFGTRARKMPLQLSALPAADRTALLGIVRRNGMSGAMLASLFPESVDLELERDHTIFGRLSSVSAMSIPYFDLYSMPLEIEEL